jgi:lysophospholipase L1-like esterase
VALAGPGDPEVRPLAPGDTTQIIVVLGSSTAAGTGASIPDSSWVGRYRNHAQALDPTAVVVNLAVPGFTTYDVMPTGFAPPPGRPDPDSDHNITRALDFTPWAIVVNLPSNDVANGYSIAEQLANFDTLSARAGGADVPLWITTCQPRDFPDQDRRTQLGIVTDSILTRYAPRAIDVWHGLAAPDGTIPEVYGDGDGIHLNDAGHEFIYLRVLDAGVWEAITTGVAGRETPSRGVVVASNLPNPFARSTTIRFRVSTAGIATLKVYDLLGREVETLLDGPVEPGERSVVWRAGEQPAGLYFCRLRAGGQAATRKMILSR